MNYEELISARKFQIKYSSAPSNFNDWMDCIELLVSDLIYERYQDQPEWGQSLKLNLQKFLKDFSRLKNSNEDVFRMFEISFNSLETEVRDLSSFLFGNGSKTSNNKAGRKGNDPRYSKMLLLGLELSQSEFGSYEPFRIYYSNALNNNFNLNDRLGAGYLLHQPPNGSDQYIIDSHLGFLPFSVSGSIQNDTQWARSLKQRLRSSSGV